MTGSTTAAQDEFADFLAKNSKGDYDDIHPEDRAAAARERRDSEDDEDQDEEDRYRASQIDAAMRMPTLNDHQSVVGGDIKLPPTAFDSGRATGVKGVIADARNYEAARRTNWKSRVNAVRRSVFGLAGLSTSTPEAPVAPAHKSTGSDLSGESGDEDKDEESFLAQWREARRRELEEETRAGVRGGRTHRRTSPSVRLFGRMDEVDAMGYLDAIEKVGREVVVAVFVYDHQCQASAAVESALLPLVTRYPAVHFVKVHYEDIEFDNAAVPTVLAYRNQGDLFANLTGIIEMIPDDEEFDSDSLGRLFSKHGML